jgi:ribosomal protein S18 acetylase RimI-like enzyme
MSAGTSDWAASEPAPSQRDSQKIRRRVRLPVVSAGAGDHPAIFHFLTALFQEPSRAEFKAAIEDPFYEPRDRLLVYRGRRLAAHAHLTHRTMQFARLQLPVAGLQWLGVLPAACGQGIGRHLLLAAEKRMAADGAAIGLIRTRIPHFFRRTGWAMCGRHNYSRAAPRPLLARLLDRGLHQRRPRNLHVRPWRRWELQAVLRIYHRNLASACGALERSEAYWQWLIRRQAYDQFYVALEGPDLLDLEETSTRVVGYAAIHGERIVELQTAGGHPRAAGELLARVCGDAIEHDRHCVLLQAPPSDPLHELFLEAGGIHYHHEADRGEVYMARLLDPLGLLRRLSDEFLRRADAAGLPRPLDLGLLVEGQKYRIEIGREGVTVTGQRIGRSYLSLNVADFTRLLLGDLDWDRAKAEGRLEVSTQLAEEAGRALFPRLPLWYPPFDHLRA